MDGSAQVCKVNTNGYLYLIIIISIIIIRVVGKYGKMTSD